MRRRTLQAVPEITFRGLENHFLEQSFNLQGTKYDILLFENRLVLILCALSLDARFFNPELTWK